MKSYRDQIVTQFRVAAHMDAHNVVGNSGFATQGRKGAKADRGEAAFSGRL